MIAFRGHGEVIQQRASRDNEPDHQLRLRLLALADDRGNCSSANAALEVRLSDSNHALST